jgi:hypothetical protein
MTRNLAAAILAMSGLTLLGIAVLDWTRYSAFVVSLLCR